MNWILVILFLCVAMVAGGLFLRSFATGTPIGAMLGFGPKPEKRLAVMEQASVDGRRRLILIRRDNVEHLIMTGGPVDLVIESGIGAAPVNVRSRPSVAESEPSQPVFARPPRSVGQAAGE
jgi:hypothetical protein